MNRVCTGRGLFIIKRGYLGLGPAGLMEGDCVTVLPGGSVLFVARSHRSKWLLTGECYVDGLVGGEAVDEWRQGRLQDMDFEIIQWLERVQCWTKMILLLGEELGFLAVVVCNTLWLGHAQKVALSLVFILTLPTLVMKPSMGKYYCKWT